MAVDPQPPPPPLTAGRLFGRALLLRCPVCGGTDVFHRWVQMPERCPTCGFRFERIEGHWIGSLGTNTVLSFGTLLLVLVATFVATYPDPSIPLMLGACLAVALAGPLFFFPYSRMIWTAADLLMRPLTPDDDVDPARLPAARGRRPR